MASDTRSRRKITDEVDASRLKKKIDHGKDLPKFGPRKAVISHLGKLDIGRHSTLSPDNGKKKLISRLSVPESRRKKEKSVIQVTMEAAKVEIPLESVGIKRKKMTAHHFKSLFKRQRSDVDVELKGSDKLSQSCSNSNRKISYEAMGIREDIHDDSQRLSTDHSPTKSKDTLQADSLIRSRRLQDDAINSGNGEKCMHPKDAETIPPSAKYQNLSLMGACMLSSKLKREEDITKDTSNVNEGGSDKLSHSCSNSNRKFGYEAMVKREDVHDDSQRLSTYHSPTKSKDALQADSLIRSRRLQDDAINSGNGEKCMHQKVAETTPPTAKCENLSLMGACMLSSKLKRKEDITKDTSNVNEGGYQFPSSKLHKDNMKVEENFAYGASEIDNVIKKVQKKCDKRMRKLVIKQNEEIKEFHRNWEEKRLRLENDHSLHLALVRSIHGKSSERLKTMDDEFAKQMEQHNLLKDAQFKDLKTKHIAMGNVEREKAAHWMAEAKACQRAAVGGTLSLHSQSEGDAGFSHSSTHIEDQNPSKSDDVALCHASLSAGDRVSNGIQSVELKKEVPPEVIEIVHIGSVDFDRGLGLNNSSDTATDTLVNPRGGTDEATAGSLPLIEQILEPSQCVLALQQVTQDKKAAHWLAEEKAWRSSELRDVGDAGCSETRTHVEDQNRSKSVCVQDDDVAQLDASLSGGERVCDETRSVEMDKEIQLEVIDIVLNETMDIVRPVELSNASDKGDDIGSTDTLVNPINGTGEADGSLPLMGEILEPSLASPDKCVFSPQQVTRDKSVCVQDDDVAQPDASLSGGERVCDETRSVEMDKEIQQEVIDIVHNETVDIVRPVELSNASDKGDEIGSTDTLVNPINGSLPLMGEMLEPSLASPDKCVFSPQQVPQDETHIEDQNKSVFVHDNAVAQLNTSLSSGLRVCDDIRSVELHKEMQKEDHEIVTSGNVDIVRPLKLKNASDDGDEVGRKDTSMNVRERIDEGPIALTEQMPALSVASSDRCVFIPQQNLTNIVLQSQQDEIHQTVENPSTSHSEVPENTGTVTTLPPNPEIRSDSKIEITISENVDVECDVGNPQNSMAISETPTVEFPNQAPVQLGVNPIYQVASSQVFVNPLQSELEKICKETERLQKSHEDMVSKLKSEYENEIAQIRYKYEKKLQNAEGEFRLKKIDLDKNQNNVLLNKILSESFRWTCLDPLSSWLPGAHLVKHKHQLPVQHSLRLSAGASASQPAPWPGTQMARPSVQALQNNASQPAPWRGSQMARPTVQALQHNASQPEPWLRSQMSRPTIQVLQHDASQPAPWPGSQMARPTVQALQHNASQPEPWLFSQMARPTIQALQHNASQPAPWPGSQMARPTVQALQHQFAPHFVGFCNRSSQNSAAPPVQVVRRAADLFSDVPPVIPRAGSEHILVGGRDIRSTAPQLPSTSQNRPRYLPPQLNLSQSARIRIPGNDNSSVLSQIYSSFGSFGNLPLGNNR